MTMMDLPRSLPLLAALFLAQAAIGCAAESEDRPEAWNEGTSEAPLTESAAPLGCVEETQRECTIVIEQASGVRSCWKGVQFCVDGAWSECTAVDADDASPG